MSDVDTLARTALTFEGTSRFVQTKKWKLHFNEAGTGHPVILLHGTGPGATGWTNFRPNIEELAKNYRVIALDLPGWGDSDPCDPLEGPVWTAHVEAIKMLMDELGLEKAALVGNSMGGIVSLMFAVKYNDRLSHLVTMGSGIATVPNLFTPAGPSEGIGIIIQTYRDPSPENFRRLVQVMVYDSSFVTEDLLKARSEAALAHPQHLENWLKPFGKPGAGLPVSGEMIGQLAAIQTPSLFIHGRDDRVVNMEFSLRSLSIVPNSRLHIFNRCGHWAQIEHAREFNALLHDFLSLN